MISPSNRLNNSQNALNRSPPSASSTNSLNGGGSNSLCSSNSTTSNTFYRSPTSDNSNAAAAAAASSLAAWSSQAAYHHMYPTSYSPNQSAYPTGLFYSNDPQHIYKHNSAATNSPPTYAAASALTYRNQEMEFLQPTGMYGRTSEEFMGWPAAHHHHHQNFKIFNWHRLSLWNVFFFVACLYVVSVLKLVGEQCKWINMKRHIQFFYVVSCLSFLFW